MRIRHPAVKSPFFELLRTVEVDLQMGDDLYSCRIELYRDTEDPGYYRAHVWELEHFRLKPTFPQTRAGRPKDISDDLLLAERATQLTGRYRRFNASSPKAALDIVISDLRGRIEHWTGKKVTFNKRIRPTRAPRRAHPGRSGPRG